jgi:hypothetical protein
LAFFERKNRDLHAFFVVVGLLDHVNDSKCPNTPLNVPEPEKEPYVIPVGVHVILDHQKVLVGFGSWHKSFAQVAALEISVDAVL